VKVGSLFSGIGGLELGLERAGMQVVWQVESDPFCIKVLEKHWPSVRRFADVKDVGKEELEACDLICGGFPCQPVSNAGAKLAQDDERWLWPEFARIIGELRPRYALMENVAGLLVRGMGDVLGDLAALGYDAEWQVLPAAAFGARHRRDRAFILAYSDSYRLEGRLGSTQGRRHEPVFRSAPSDPRALRWDITASPFLRATDGLPNRVDRIKSLGNAVVPQVSEWIGKRIMEAR